MRRKPRRTSVDGQCAWCHIPLTTMPRRITDGRHTRYGALPAGVGVRVCSAECPQRPEGAPVAAHFAVYVAAHFAGWL